MKKVLFMLCCVSVVAFVGCKKDDPKTDPTDLKPADPTYYLQYKGKKYELANAFWNEETFFYTPSYDEFRIRLAGPKVSYNSWIQSLMGVDNGFSFIVTTPPNVTSVPANTYSYASTIGNPNLMYNISVLLSWNFSSIGLSEVRIHNGTLTVAKVDNTYTINFSGTDDDGVPVKCFYKGTMTKVPEY